MTTQTAAVTAGSFSAADESFFRITASLFPPAFLFGAGVLLGSYDDEVGLPVAAVSAATCPVASSVQAPSSVSA